MQYAYNNKKELLSVLTFEKLQASTEQPIPLFCPHCGQPVVYRKGEQVRGHFAHKAKKALVIYRENESFLHKYNKQLIAIQLRSLGLYCELEKAMSHGDRRADVYFRYQNNAYVIELQYSPISFLDVCAREEDYLKNNVSVIWLLGEKSNYFRWKKQYTVRFLPFIKAHNKFGLFLPFWNEENESVQLVFFDYYGRTQYRSIVSIDKYLKILNFIANNKRSHFTIRVCEPPIDKFNDTRIEKMICAYLKAEGHRLLLMLAYERKISFVEWTRRLIIFQGTCCFCKYKDWEVLLFLHCYYEQLRSEDVQVYLAHLKENQLFYETIFNKSTVLTVWLSQLITRYNQAMLKYRIK